MKIFVVQKGAGLKEAWIVGSLKNNGQMNFERFQLEMAFNCPLYHFITVKNARNYPNTFHFIKRTLVVSALILYIADKLSF